MALSLGRFVVGLGVGVSAVVVPAYVGEMAPPHKRGAVVITYELMLCLGMIASGVADFALKAGGGSSPRRVHFTRGHSLDFKKRRFAVVLCARGGV